MEFGSVSYIMITGHNNPTIMCDHQAGVVGNDIKQITIQNIKWDKCNGIKIKNFTIANVIDCTFQYSTNVSLTSDYLTGLVNINATNFHHNIGSIQIDVALVNVTKSNFYNNKADALKLFGSVNMNQIVKLATITGCNFTNNTGYSVECIGNYLPLPQLVIRSCNFNDNNNTALYIESCNVAQLDNVAFCNNTATVSGGAAIRAMNSTMHITGVALFRNNVAVTNGGAINLHDSNISVHYGSVRFLHNSADNGGAIYIDDGSYIIHTTQTSLEFIGNVATYYGAAVYVNIPFYPDELKQFNTIQYYYQMLTSAKCYEDNTANSIENCAYFNFSAGMCFYGGRISNKFFSSPMCRMTFNNAEVTVDAHYQDDDFVYECSLHSLHFDVVITDYFNNLVGPVNVTADCKDYFNTDPYNYYIDNIHHNITLIYDKTFLLTTAPYYYVTLGFCAFGGGYWTTNTLHAIVKPGNSCNTDITHIVWDGVCLPFDCNLLMNAQSVELVNDELAQLGMTCDSWSYDNHNNESYYISSSSGYWFSDGFWFFTIQCPTGHCDPNYSLDDYREDYPFQKSYPNSNKQCRSNWTGLACGNCISDHFAIPFDTSDCVHSKKCFKRSSVAPNLLLLLCVSFFYWCLVISFIFVLLHFQLNITAGYAYGIVFYYSVLEVVINMLIKVRYIDIEYPVHISLLMLPFLSNFGYLRVPFFSYLKLCLHGAETIDHVFISYIHPLIVICLVGLIFITARRFVVVA